MDKKVVVLHYSYKKHSTMKNIRIYALLALLLLVCGVTKAQQWRYLQTGVVEDLYNVCCIDDNTIFVCGQNGVILKSTNGGDSWVEKYRRAGCQMTEICFADQNNGYAVCDSTLDDYSHQWFLVKTCDGGETWNDVGNPVFSWVESYTALSRQFFRTEMFLNDTDNLVVAVSFDGIYKSTDGGLTMRRLDNDFTINETRGIFFEDNVGYLLWDDGEDFMSPVERYPGVAQSEDNGETWTLKEDVTNITVGISYAHFYDKNHIRLFGVFQVSEYNCYGLLDTYDGFDSFEMVGGGTYSYFQYYEEYIRAKFTENGWGISMLWEEDMPGVGRAVAYTEDDGLSWTFYSGYGLPTYRLYDIDGTDTTFYISCAGGNVLKSRQFTLMGTGENVSQVVTIYPNPATDRVVIEGIEAAEVNVYNALGQVVKTVLGTNEIDLSGLVDGVYLLRIMDAEKKVYTNRITKR